MEVILLERVPKLGQMGEVVRVRAGYARNFLLRTGKALRATDDNRARFETMKVDLEARNLAEKGEAEKVSAKLDGQALQVLRQASETGQLYGSVSTRDLAVMLGEKGFSVNRTQIQLNAPIKMIGVHRIVVSLHSEVESTITLNVARNAEEAERQARGEDMTVRRDRYEEEDRAERAAARAEALLEPDADADDADAQGSGEENT